MNTRQELQIKKVLLLFFPVAGISSYIASNFIFSVGKVIFTSYLCLLILLLAKYRRKGKTAGLPILPFLLVCVFSVGYFRTYFFDSKLVGLSASLIISANYLAILLVAKLLAENCKLIRVEKVLLFSFQLLFLLNVLLFSFGFENAAVKSQIIGEMETIFTFIGGRQMLPLSIGSLDSSTISLIAGVGALFLYREIEINAPRQVLVRSYYVVLFFVSILMMALTGGRTVIGVLLLMLFLTSFGFENKRKSFLLIVILSLFFPLFYLPFASPLFSSDTLGFFEILSRTGDVSEVVLLNNRVLVWGSVLNYLYDYLKWINVLFGYGMYGQTVSGAVDTYNFLFLSSYASVDTISVHNFIFQVFLNSGLIGITIYCLVVLQSITFLWGKPKYNTALYLILTCILASTLEIQLATDTYLFMMFLFVVSYFLSLKNITSSR